MCLLDHGASVSIINETIVETLGMKIKQSSKQITGFNGKSQVVYGYVTCEVILSTLAPSKRLEMDLYVVEIKYPILLGYDVIKSLGLIVDAKQSLIIWDRNSCGYGKDLIDDKITLKQIDNLILFKEVSWID